MKRILLIVILCVVYDFAAFEFQRSDGSDTMFSSLALPILVIIIMYTALVYHLSNSVLDKSITLMVILTIPIYFYILLHIVAFSVLIMTGISAVFQSL